MQIGQDTTPTEHNMSKPMTYARKRELLIFACSKSKRPHAAAPNHLYTGQLFRKAHAYAERYHHGALSGILSAKHGFLTGYDTIQPYDETLADKSPAGRHLWANMAARQIAEYANSFGATDFIVFAGKGYQLAIERAIPQLKKPIMIHYPLAGMGIGEQLQWLNQQIQ